MASNTILNYMAVSIGVISILFAIYQFYDINRQAKRSNERISQAESKAREQPEKVKPAWDLARITLESYFNRNLSQITAIFWLCVIVMGIGFGIICWGVSQAIQSQSTVIPAAIASVAGVIIEFIGATFLFIYRSTIEQAIDYLKTLERINSVGMAMQILDTMPDEVKPEDLKSKTKAIIAELLLQKAQITTDTPPK